MSTDPERLGFWVQAGDGPVFVEHTQDEIDRYWRGVDREAAELMEGRWPED